MKDTKDIIYLVDGKNDVGGILHLEAMALKFPLSKKDMDDITTLEAKYDAEENCAGLAAPQIGISKKIIVFATPSDPEFKKFRPDWTDSMPKTIWINPSYTGIKEFGFTEDYEACFSTGDLAGLVSRYKRIEYEAYDIEGNYVKGEAEGFLARIIQHETDHTNGILFTDKAIAGSVMSLEAYREKRRKALEVNLT